MTSENNLEQIILEKKIRDAQRGDPDSMRELGDHYLGVSNHEKGTEAYRTGIEWYERAAWCNDVEAAKRVMEITGKKAGPPNFLKQEFAWSMLMIVLWIVIVYFVFVFKAHVTGVFLLSAGTMSLFRIMSAIFQQNEAMNSKHYKKLKEFMKSAELKVLFVPFSLILTYSSLIVGFVLTFRSHGGAFALIIKTTAFIVALIIVSLDFLRLIRVKWKHVKHSDNVTRTAEEFETTRLNVELTSFYIKATACFIAIALIARFI